jgi:hypothetical protein
VTAIDELDQGIHLNLHCRRITIARWRAVADASSPCLIARDRNRSLDMGTWDARAWLAGLIGCERSDLAVRSVDRYGPAETQARYERGDEAVARLIVVGPIVPMGEQEGRGHWDVSVRIGFGSEDVHSIEVPAADEIVY